MSSYHGYFVYMWLFPLFLEVVLPLMMLFCWSIYKAGCLLMTFIVGAETANLRWERRVDKRYGVDGLGEVVATNSGVPVGRVVNVSMKGICVEALENVREIPEGELSLNLGGSRDVFTLKVRPRWERLRKSGITFGATIIGHSSGWIEFITDGSQFAPHYQGV